MILLRIYSFIAVFLPSILAGIYASRTSYIVSWIYAIQAIAFIPLIGLPIGIGVNLWRLNWPFLLVIPFILVLVASCFASLLPAGSGGISKLSIPFIILIIEYLVLVSITSFGDSWDTYIKILVLFALSFPLLISAGFGLHSQLETKSLAKAAEREDIARKTIQFLGLTLVRNSEYKTIGMYDASFILENETLEHFTKYLNVSGQSYQYVKNALAFAKDLAKGAESLQLKAEITPMDDEKTVVLDIQGPTRDTNTNTNTNTNDSNYEQSIYIMTDVKEGVLTYRYTRRHYRGTNPISLENFMKEIPSVRKAFIEAIEDGGAPLAKGFNK